jgi:hypothetical protein
MKRKKREKKEECEKGEGGRERGGEREYVHLCINKND